MFKNRPLSKLLGNKSFALVAVWIVILAVFAAINRNYLTPGNIKNMFNTAFNIGMLAVGLSCLLISGVIDLSTGYTAMLGGIVVALLLQKGIPWVPALFLTLVVGALIGLVNAFFANALNFPSFISTLAVGTALYGIALVITKAQVVPINNPSFWALGSDTIFKVIPMPYLITAILMLIYGFILLRTRFGRRMYIVGGNHQAARLAGINPKKITTVLFINNSAIACLVGALVAARMRMGSPSSNIGSDLDAITAAVLGGVSFMGGIGGMFSAFIGVMLLTCFKNGLVIVGLGTYYQTVATGVLLISALAIDYLREKSRLKSLKSGEPEKLDMRN